MTLDERTALRRELETRILREITDPAGWLPMLRRVIEALGLNPAVTLTLPTSLRNACGDIVTDADRDSMTAERVRVAIAEVVRA